MSAKQSSADVWVAPPTFRAGVEDLVQITDRLMAELEGQVVVPVADVDFLARRLHRLARSVHHALPLDVT